MRTLEIAHYECQRTSDNRLEECAFRLEEFEKFERCPVYRFVLIGLCTVLSEPIWTATKVTESKNRS